MKSCDDFLKEVEGRAARATKGQWRAGNPDSEIETHRDLSSNVVYMLGGNNQWMDWFQPHRDEDAEFIAASRTDVEALVRMVRRAKELPCYCGIFEWTETDCPPCLMRKEFERLAGELP